MSERVAIVSVAGRFPGSGADLNRFWANVAAGTDCSREVPRDRWILPPERCTDPRVANPDTVYSTRGYYLDPFDPDLTDLDLDPGLVGELDPLFHLVLDVGNRAWREARTDKVDRDRVGVVLGNICLPTDCSSDLCRAVLGSSLGLFPSSPPEPLNRYVAGLPAGLLARGLGLGNGSFTLDAACASSLYAIKLAADELLAGRADAMLAGGCSRPDCQYTQMGFAQLRALSVSGKCSPFDAAADGLMVGEGAGIFLLKRLTDAMKHGDRVLGIIAGVGLSNDMHGNLLAPAKEGQLRAMRQAYDRAGWEPNEVDLIECHATGTPVGDAVEFDSLRELWGDSGWTPGKCPIGSVKSTVGHLLTGAGAAALTKVLMAMRAEQLPPQANFASAAEGLRYADGPFRVLSKPERWNRRSTLEPRRAAVSGFGFGGVNAHLLVEEWTRIPSRRPVRGVDVPGEGPDRLLVTPPPKLVTTPPPRLVAAQSAQERATLTPAPRGSAAVPIAVVGLATHFGESDDLRAFQERALSGDPGTPSPKKHGWELAAEPCPPAFGIEELRLPIDRFRIPPKELEETLPQQLLMLKVAAAALDDCRGRDKDTSGGAPRTGVFVGLGLDPNTMNYHLRWAALAAQGSGIPAPSPPLSANRTMGALGSIAASRIARTFHFGGPSHTVCSEEGSAARAVELGVRALQSGDLNRVIVGGVDLACDPRAVVPGKVKQPGEGAAAFVLKRLSDAERDGDRVYAVIRGVGVASDDATARIRAGFDAGDRFVNAVPVDASRDVGQAGAATAAASLAKACLALWQEVAPNPPRFWLRNRDDEPRRASVSASGADGTFFSILLEEYAPRPAQPTRPTRSVRQVVDLERAEPLGARPEAVFVVEAESPEELREGLERLRAMAATPRHIEALAREWFRYAPPSAAESRAVSFVARSREELAEQIAFASQSLRESPEGPLPATAKPALRDRVFYSPQPLGPKGRVAFVFPGSGNQFDGMGRDLSAWWPDVMRRQQSENELLRSQYAPEYFWTGRVAQAPPREMMFGQVTVGALVSDIAMSLGVRCDAMVGLSLGESAGLFGIRAWRSRDEMFKRMEASTLFVSDLAPPYESARRHYGFPPSVDVEWVIGVVGVSPDDIHAAMRPGLRAYLLIVNTPHECVIGGLRADVEKLAVVLGKTVTALSGVTLAHCEAGKPVELPYRELHTLPVTAPPGVMVYSGVWGKAYKPTDKMCAESITAGLLETINVPAVVERAYRDGVRAFVEMGPGNSCVRMIDAVLGDRPHLARSAHAAKQDALSQVLRLVANLAAERLPVDLGALYGRESVCTAHRAKAAATGKEIVIPVGGMGNVAEPTPLAVDPTPLATLPAPPPEGEGRMQKPSALTPPSFSGKGAGGLGSSEPGEGHKTEAVPSGGEVQDFTSPLEGEVALEHRDAAGGGYEARREIDPTPLAVDPTPFAAPPAVEFRRASLDKTWGEGRTTDVPGFAPPSFSGKGDGGVGSAGPYLADVVETATNVQILSMQAQEAFLRVNQGFIETAGQLLHFQTQLVEALASAGYRVSAPPVTLPVVSRLNDEVPRSLTWEQCCAFAAGKVADALGAKFAEIDSFPTRVRLPDGPLQLVDRITSIEGEPLSMTRGRVVTEHAVHEQRWYLEEGRIPTAISVEAGQADLFLSGYLGIDLQTRGLAVYRLLDAVVSFHRGLPRVGETVVYDIHIDEFVKQGDSWIFRFRFEGTVNGEPFISMRNGVAGFFTADALAAGKGIVQTALDKKPMPGKRPADWRDLVPQRECALSPEQVNALRAGDLATAFGPEFAGLPLTKPLTLPGGMLRLVDRVPLIDPTGGRFGIGFVRAEFDIHPDDWFLTCHFVDDMVMPGTLMYECCLHTLRVLLMRMGWVGEAGETVCEPVPEVNSRLKCRGQVIASTRTVTYEVTVKELGYGPEPFCIADALMYADGKPIVEITNMSLRMSGLTREKLEGCWAAQQSPPIAMGGLAPRVLYDSASILAYSNGNPSEAFGEPYKCFDRDRVIARLPGPPYQFLDCVTDVVGEPFVLKAGAACETQYEVPETAWYFTANRCKLMPFSVLLEIALQPCGWLAAYCGSALTSKDDLSFRNLGGKAVQHRPVTTESGLLVVNVKMTNVSNSAGMIIQHYDMKVCDRVGIVYEGTTYFGFFSKPALANQIGIRDAKLPLPTDAELARAERGVLPSDPPFPGPMLRMVDRIEAFIPDGGTAGLGLIVGKIAVDPSFWFFQAHFYQDPVWPGSLGLESFLQLLKYVAWKRWKDQRDPTPNPLPQRERERNPAPPSFSGKGDGGLGSLGYQTPGLNRKHTWVYRGQVLPTDKEVTVMLEVTAADDEKWTLTANGFLTVDGRVIYQMTDFTLE